MTTVAQPVTGLPVSHDDVRAAAGRLDGVAHRTPVHRSRSFDEETGKGVWFKCEQFQRSGSFKFRGAYNTLAMLDPDARAYGVVAFSSGNHAQAVALAAREFGVPAVIVMPDDAPAVKLAATRGYGAEVVQFDRHTGDREDIARRLGEERGLTVIPPFNHPAVIAGQGTLALELLEDVPDLDALVVPVGGGGMVGGVAVAAKGINPDISIYGVETEGADDARRSLVAGEIVTIDPPNTIADGIRTVAVGTLTFPIMRSLLAGVVTVTDDEVRHALRYLATRLKLLVEPTGAVGAAAVLAGKLPADVERAGVVLCGGNADPAQLAAILAAS